MDERDTRTLRDVGFTSDTDAYLTGLDLDSRICDLTAEMRATLQAVWGLDQRDDVPPGPWQWRSVRPDASSDMGGEALVGSDGRWVAWSEGGHGVISTANAAVRDVLARAGFVERLPELFEVWEAYRDAEGPVGQAFALGELANVMTRLRWAYDGDLDDE